MFNLAYATDLEEMYNKIKDIDTGSFATLSSELETHIVNFADNMGSLFESANSSWACATKDSANNSVATIKDSLEVIKPSAILVGGVGPLVQSAIDNISEYMKAYQNYIQVKNSKPSETIRDVDVKGNPVRKANPAYATWKDATLPNAYYNASNLESKSRASLKNITAYLFGQEVSDATISSVSLGEGQFMVTIEETLPDGNVKRGYKVQDAEGNLLKEIYQSQKINIVLIIKKFLLNNCYVFGQCNRSYVEKNDNIELSLFNYVVTGFDDINRQFTIYGLNAKENFYCVKIDYETFASALFDTLKPNIELTLWRYNLDACIDFDIQNIAFELEDYINSANRRNHYTEDKEYGIKAIERLGMYFIENSQCKKSRDEVYLKKLLCHKSYMRDRIACLGHHGYIDIKSYPYAEKVSLISKEILDVGCLINQSNKLTFITLLKQLFSEMIEIEKQYLPKVLDELKSFLR